MQRTIKFRGQYTNGQWVYGDLYREQDETMIWDGVDLLYVDKNTVGQFVKHENGVDFYEGDIYERFNYRYVVEWNDCGFVSRVCARRSGEWQPFSDDRRLFEVVNDDGFSKVVGTIHDESLTPCP